MRSVDTHQPKSTIFAHLLGLPCSLSPTKETNKYTTILQTFQTADTTRREVKSEPIAGQFIAQLHCLKMIASLGKWREDDPLVTMWVNEGRLPLNVNI